MQIKGKRRHKRKPSKAVGNAKTLVSRLFSMADEANDRSLADRYVQIARKTAMKVKLKLDSCFKRRYCHNCHTYLRPSVNCRVRLRKNMVVYYCLDCKHFNRIGYKKKIQP